MTVTKTDLIKIVGEVTCVVDTVESGVGYMYIGTNRGMMYKYNVATGAITTLQTIPGVITAMVYDASTYIYFGTNEGKIYRRTVADATLTTLIDVMGVGIESLTLYSSVLYAGLTGGTFASVTIS